MARQAFLASRANAFLSVVMLFFTGAASYYPCLGSEDQKVALRSSLRQKNSGGPNAPPEGVLPCSPLPGEHCSEADMPCYLPQVRLAVK